MIGFFSAGCGRRNSARRALPGEGRWTERWVRAFGFFAGCRPDLLGLPYRASRLGRKGWLGPSGLFAGCRPDLLPYRVRRWDEKGDGYP